MPAKSPFSFEEFEALNPTTEKIIGCAFKVSNTLGTGFIEKVYENALAHQLRKEGLNVKQQFAIQVWYDGIVVGNFVADLVVDDCILLELKAVSEVEKSVPAKCKNYLRATDLQLCLLINFGTPRISVNRII